MAGPARTDRPDIGWTGGPATSSPARTAQAYVLDAEGIVHTRRHWPPHECRSVLLDCPAAWHERVVTREEFPARWEWCRTCAP